ncbi:MAG TPA: hypothetical protein VMB48_09660 [Steroidobacteraceae bacterium]|nr:hypothetical protein [Steroidobacteraceae bacterium]
MYSKFPLIAAAVSAALVSAHAGATAPPTTLSVAANTTYSLVVAGSSAAQPSVATAFENDVCGGAGNTLLVSTAPDKNYNAYSCYASKAVTNSTTGATLIPSGQLVTIYYRSEGGSVVGALPVANEVEVKRLNLNDTTNCPVSVTGTTATCTVSGTSSLNGPNDSWTGAVTEDYVQLGVTDVEPAQLVNANYPSLYATSVWGPINPKGLGKLAKVQAIQQVFGIAVNTSGVPLDTADNGPNVNLSRESIANIYNGTYTDWSSVPDAITGNPIATSSSAITLINREAGSGTRTQFNIYYYNYGCGGSQSVLDPTPATDNYSTGDELNAAEAAPGSIAYASIDNLTTPKNTSYTNLVLATINGVTPSTLAAAAGEYDEWYEATLVPNTSKYTNNASDVSTWLQQDVPNLSAAPLAKDINVIPFLGSNTPAIPLGTANGTERTGTSTYGPTSLTTSIAIYVNPYTRNASSCSIPVEDN